MKNHFPPPRRLSFIKVFFPLARDSRTVPWYLFDAVRRAPDVYLLLHVLFPPYSAACRSTTTVKKASCARTTTVFFTIITTHRKTGSRDSSSPSHHNYADHRACESSGSSCQLRQRSSTHYSTKKPNSCILQLMVRPTLREGAKETFVHTPLHTRVFPCLFRSVTFDILQHIP